MSCRYGIYLVGFGTFDILYEGYLHATVPLFDKWNPTMHLFTFRNKKYHIYYDVSSYGISYIPTQVAQAKRSEHHTHPRKD